jgi:hypothetical protein
MAIGRDRTFSLTVECEDADGESGDVVNADNYQKEKRPTSQSAFLCFSAF